MKKVIAYILTFSLILTNVGFINANEISDEDSFALSEDENLSIELPECEIPNIILSEKEINEFNLYLKELETENEEYQNNPRMMSMSASLGYLAGTFYIPGIGTAIITVGGAIIVAGVTVSALSTLGKKVSNWAFNYKFDKSAENAVKNANQNKRSHILATKHNWNKFYKKPDWNNIGPLIVKTLKDGSEKSEGRNIYVRTLVHKGKTIQVRFIKDAKGFIQALSTAWVK